MSPEHPSTSTEFTRARPLTVEEAILVAETAPKGEPDTFGATPLNQVRALMQQLELLLVLQEKVYRDVPGDVPQSILDYVHTTFARRFRGRADANEENYFSALRSKDYYDPASEADREIGYGDDYVRSLYTRDEYIAHAPQLLEMIERAELGTASPAELLIVRDAMGIRSVELACLTHPYGKGIAPEKGVSMIEEMRSSVCQNVELLGGTYYDKPETRYRAKEVILDPETGTESLSQGILMTRKRTLGVMPDGTVIRERSSFVLRTDMLADIDPEALARMEAVDRSKDGWQDALIKAGNIQDWVETLLENDEFSTAIPISTTIYAYNEETATEIRVHDTIRHIKKNIVLDEEYPHISAVLRGYDLENERPIENVETHEEWTRQEGEYQGMRFSAPLKSALPSDFIDED